MEYTGICITCGAEKALRWPKPLTQYSHELLPHWLRVPD